MNISILIKLKVSSGIELAPADQALEYRKCREWKCTGGVKGGITFRRSLNLYTHNELYSPYIYSFKHTSNRIMTII